MPIYSDILKTWKQNSNTMVETGSFIGDGIAKGLEAGYDKIFSFEIIPENYNVCIERFKDNSAVNCILGDSIKLLPGVLASINERIVFWLDSHFVGETETDLYPIINELKIIKDHFIKNHTILIDDVRLFADGKDPAMPISIAEVKDFILTINSDYKFAYEQGFIGDD
ncbi:MAG: hypothetical protein ACM3PE_11555, partial [Deltaproteobacteria bacterium]